MIAVGRTSQEDYRRKDWHSRASRALVCGLGGVVALAGDPAPPAMPPRRGFGGDGARCRLSEERIPTCRSSFLVSLTLRLTPLHGAIGYGGASNIKRTRDRSVS